MPSAAADEDNYLECEKKWIFALLMFVGGFYGAYTYSIRGGVFCNAQTANFVLFAMSLGGGNWRRALYYIIPMSAYLAGAIVSEILPTPVKRKYMVRWDTLLIFIEIIAVVILGFLPESVPFQVSQVTVNFICSMQYNTFRQAQGVPMATTFCTNHLRQTGIAIAKAITKKGERKHILRALEHIRMIFVFVLGAVISTVLCSRFLGRAIWGALIPLAVVFADLFIDDIKQHGDLGTKPRGH